MKTNYAQLFIGLLLFVLIVTNLEFVLRGILFVFLVFVLKELFKIDDDRDNKKFPRK